MFGLPVSTEIRKSVPKKLIYEKFAAELSGNRKKEFDDDISRIIVIHEISSASVNIREGEEVKSIFAVFIELKNRDYKDRNISLIAKLFGQRLLLVLHFDDEYRLAIYQTKILYSEWFHEGDFTLRLEGLNLDSVWQNLVIQISGIVPKEDNSLDEQIVIEGEMDKLRRQIEKLEAQARRESQSKKKYELHQRVMEYKRKMEEYISG